jgi:riboflavin synthase
LIVFTGIVEEVGVLLAREEAGGVGREADAARLRIRARKALEGVALGDSIAVNGVCLTVTGFAGAGPGGDGTAEEWTTDVMAETLRRSSLGALGAGDPVNLERAVTPHTRLGGHLVQGHVDGVGTVERVAALEDARLLDLRVPEEVARVSVPLGSITVDGVSLTVNAIPAPGVIQISLIPFTLQHTTLGERQAGDRVHLEADTIGKYVAQLLRARGDLGAS